MKDKIKLRITREDARRCDEYCHNCNCLAATAIKRQLQPYTVSASVDHVDINGVKFNFSIAGAIRIRRSYRDSNIMADKIKRGFRPFTVILTKAKV